MSLLHTKFHKGNIFENLADFLLGSLGISNPPRRQFDHGYDFYCYLSETAEGNKDLLKFDFPYNIQIKSSKDSLIAYGNRDFEKWKKEDIEWLFKHETPFFIGFLDTDRYELKIYDTTGVWQLYVNEQINCSQVVFKQGSVTTDNYPTSDIPPDFDYLSLPMRRNVTTVELPQWGKGKGSGFAHLIDMGNPIVTISVDDTKNHTKIELVKNVMKAAIKLEIRNIANRNIGINFFSEIKNNIINQPNFITGAVFRTHAIQYASNLKSHLREALISLLMNAEYYQEYAVRDKTKEILKLLPPAYYYSQLYQQNQQLFDWIG